MFFKKNRNREIFGILLILFSLLVFFSLFSFHIEDKFNMKNGSDVLNIAGPFGAWISTLFRSAFGYSSFVFPIVLFYAGFSFLPKQLSEKSLERCLALSIIFISSAILFSLVFSKKLPEFSGGYIGLYISAFLEKIIGRFGCWLITLILNLVGFVLLGIISLSSIIEITTEKGKNMSTLLKTWFSKRKVKDGDNNPVPLNNISSSLDSRKKEKYPWITKEKLYIYPDGSKKIESFDLVSDESSSRESLDEFYIPDNNNIYEEEMPRVFRNYDDPDDEDGPAFNSGYFNYSAENDENDLSEIDRETGDLFDEKNISQLNNNIDEVDINFSEPGSFEDINPVLNNEEKDIIDVKPYGVNNRITSIETDDVVSSSIPDENKTLVESFEKKYNSEYNDDMQAVEKPGDDSLLKENIISGDLIEADKTGTTGNEMVQPSAVQVKEKVEVVRKNMLTGEGYEKEEEPEETRVFDKISINEEYIIPSAHLNRSVRIDRSSWENEIKRNSELLVKTLKDFGIPSKVVKVNRGPVVTLYEMQIASGIRVNKISGLSDDIAMALAASRVRVVAPIPGKSAIGVEVPNQIREEVTLGDVLQTTEYRNCEMMLKVALGKDILGFPVMLDIKRQPHLLIAGATGAGKSVCINSIITSLIYKYDPNHVRFIMVDPKMVELQLYNGLPHLLTPVITEPDVAPLALKWAIYEMERRYRLLSEYSTRDIERYNKKVDKHGEEYMERLPYIVIIVDELADLMMVAPKEIENYITRIAQKARAVGIHLVLATQRPSVDIITGVIKANFPSRIAFQVAQKTDSRTILDQNGAEQLLGKGDLLYLPPTSSYPIRIQGAYISEEETIKIVRTVRKMGEPRFVDIEGAVARQEFGNDDNADEDELFVEALKIIEETKKASASYLQRRLSIGYNRAARIIERMEELGYVGPQQGSKPRDVYV